MSADGEATAVSGMMKPDMEGDDPRKPWRH